MESSPSRTRPSNSRRRSRPISPRWARSFRPRAQNSTENRGQTTIFRIEGESVDMASWKIVVRPRFSAFIAAALVLFTTLAQAQDPAAGYPSRTIRIFGQGTGSTADYLSRYLALKLTERLGQPVIVDSRAGAGAAVDDHRLAPALGELQGEEARQVIGGAARALAEDADRPRRVARGRVLRLRERREEHEGRGDGCRKPGTDHYFP